MIVIRSLSQSIAVVCALLALGGGAPRSATAEPQHALAMHGNPKFGPDMTHFPFVNPQAPKGGRLTLGLIGSYDSLNPMIIKGVSAAGVREYIYESLLTRGIDEPFTLYGLIAETVEVPDDRSAITFHLNPNAKFSDGQPITVADVLFSYRVLKEHGRPNHRTYYKKVAKTETLDDRTVRFTFDTAGDREMPLILGLMPILPSHLLDEASFQKTTLEAPIGSGPYVISTIDAGRSVTYKRDPDWWARDLPVTVGFYNFDEIRYDYFREASVQFETFASGGIDSRAESDPGRWAEAYDFPAVQDGRVVKRTFDTGLPAGMTGLVFNTRRDVFKDARVRQALIKIFDFEWLNRTLYHGLYERTQSYFARSDLASTGRAADAREQALLSPFGADTVDVEILNGRYAFPVSPGTGQNRDNWRTALGLLRKAGYKLADRKLINADTGKQLSFEILAVSTEQERLMLAFVRDLERLGIKAQLRVVDSAQYQSRRTSYDYDMIQFSWGASLSPGNEQLFRWGAENAKLDGTFNIAGVADPAVDAMIDAMLTADNREDFESAVRALDRVLLSGHYVIPLFHLPKQWAALWSRIKTPPTTPLFGYDLNTWWHSDAPAKQKTDAGPVGVPVPADANRP